MDLFKLKKIVKFKQSFFSVWENKNFISPSNWESLHI